MFHFYRSAAWISDRGPNVLVQAEQIVGIVFPLECYQTSVVDPIGRPHPVVALVAYIVDVDAIHRKWLQSCMHLAHPRDVGLVSCGLRPYGHGKAIVSGATVDVSGSRLR